MSSSTPAANSSDAAAGPLAGLRIVELSSIGPGPMAAMLLADLGATVLRVDRAEPTDLGVKRPLRFNVLLRGRRAIGLDLKQPRAVELVLALVERADALIEGFRPGVTERLGLGPDTCLRRNGRLVYGRITGWGQDGPLAQAAGHDINYIALTGVLDAIGRAGQPPTVPLALVGDFAGGALYLAMGVLAALLQAKTSGRGQVVDASIVDGVTSMASIFYGLHAAGLWNAARGTNVLDSGAPFYDTYACSDGLWISIGPIESRFHAQLLERLGLPAQPSGQHLDRAHWPQARQAFADVFATRTRADWCALLEGSDVCFAPVLGFDEAPNHPHLRARGAFVTVDGVVQPAPSPRFSASPARRPLPPQAPDPATAAQALAGWLGAEEIDSWCRAGIFGVS